MGYDFYYYTGIVFWYGAAFAFLLMTAWLVLFYTFHAFCSVVFLIRRFRKWENGGFEPRSGATWYFKTYLFISRFFMYTLFPSWRLDYVEDETGTKVWRPFCNEDGWRSKTQWFERIISGSQSR